MGGLSGHMMHPYDNLRLSKEELNELGIMLNNEDFDNEDKE